MRADRLLSLMMLLQARGRMTASQLAAELEVSERTVYRDINALSAAGVPVYASRGPGGGCALLDSYRTTLTGLNEDEARALFMLNIPAPLAELGVAGELQMALRKLSAALPASRRADEEKTRQRIHLDTSRPAQPAEPVTHLQTIQRALWQDQQLDLTYQLAFGAQTTRRVAPYGLVASTDIWHLIAGLESEAVPRVFRVSQVTNAQLLDEHFQRPADFDLVAFWQMWSASHEANRPHYPVAMRVAPALLDLMQVHGSAPWPAALEGTGPADSDGWVTLTLDFESLEQARTRLLGYGSAVEVVEPEALRKSLLDHANQILALYGRQGALADLYTASGLVYR